MTKFIASVLLLLPLSAFGHAGHSHVDSNSILHYFSSPEHALPIAGIALLTAVLLIRRNRKAARKKA